MPTPHISRMIEIPAEWIDFNGHMNMANYPKLFDMGSDEFFVAMGFGPDYATSRKLTTYAGEFHICYLRELLQGARAQVWSWILDHDEKRIHTWQEIRHEDGWIAATGEGMTLHIDMTGPRVAPMPDDIAANVARHAAAHAYDGRPERAGRVIGIKR